MYKITQKDENGMPREVKINGKTVHGYDLDVGSIELKEFDESSRSFVAIASAGTPDRIEDVINIKGLDIDEYMKNPVVMWAHKYDQLPLGKSLEVEKNTRKKQLVVRPYFDDHEFAVKVFNSYLKRIMRGFSVGLIPYELEGRNREEMSDIERNKAGLFGGRFIKSSQLLEYSAAPIPMHPDALASMKSFGLPVEDITTAFEAGYSNSKVTLHDGSIWFPIVDCSTYFDPKVLRIDEYVKVVSAKPFGSSGSDLRVAHVLGYIFPGDYDDERIAEWLSSKGMNAGKVFDVDKEKEIPAIEIKITEGGFEEITKDEEVNIGLLIELEEDKEKEISSFVPHSIYLDKEGSLVLNTNMGVYKFSREWLMSFGIETREEEIVSVENKERLEGAISTIVELLEKLGSELETPTQEVEEEEDIDSILAAVEEVATELVQNEEINFNIDESDLRTTIREVLSENFAVAVADSINTNVRKMRGNIE